MQFLNRIILVIGFFVTVILSGLLGACEKEPYDVLIPVHFEWTDDVGPQIIKVWVDGKYNQTEWTINDEQQREIGEKETKFSSFIFSEDDGIAYIQFNGYQDENAHYYGELNLEIPSVATDIELQGLLSKQFQKYIPLVDKDYTASFTFSNGKKNLTRQAVYNPTLIKNDTIWFDEPLVFDIQGFEKSVGSQFTLSISLSDPKGTSPFFQQTLNLKDEYFESRRIFHNKSVISKSNTEVETNQMFLLTDWKR